ncbi:MAG: type I-E CRISPR-associated protein Cse1/CasA [Akkermansiaceae bacterium]|nr:type I-E CRISPR-associated protein Cse1/CasA [Akkermansiaceae bacterium]
MNLVTDPFIPIRFSDGKCEHLNLCQLFQDAANITDLSVNTQERISLLRLLVGITQAALGLPPHEEAWDDFGQDLEEKVSRYLEDWKPSFELFGEDQRFLQSKLPAREKAYPINQIDYTAAAGNTATTLDHRHPSRQAGQLALTLLVYQNFFIGGSMASKVKGNGPSLKTLHTFLKGKNLRETILYNCIDQDTLKIPVGRPVWEKPLDAANATQTYLGRLIPAPCKVWLGENGANVQIDQGFVYPEFEEIAPETSSTVIVLTFNKKEEKRLMRAQPNKGIWRDLHSLTVLSKSKNEGRAPQILISHKFQLGGTQHLPIWCGEMIKAKDAKILDSVESSFELPAQLFENSGRELYQQGVNHADFRAKLLADAVKAYGKFLFIEKPDPSAAQRHFWHRLDQESAKLLNVVASPALLDKEKFGPSSDPWSRAVHFAAVEAYQASCPAISSRQIQAHATGLTKLNPRKKKAAKKAATQTTLPL